MKKPKATRVEYEAGFRLNRADALRGLIELLETASKNAEESDYFNGGIELKSEFPFKRSSDDPAECKRVLEERGLKRSGRIFLNRTHRVGCG